MVQWVKIFSGEQEAQQRIASGKLQLLIVDGTRICLVNRDEKFFAVQDACSHNGESLSKGSLNYLGELICPLHNYCFNIHSGREISYRSADLKTYPIKIDEAGFFIGL